MKRNKFIYTIGFTAALAMSLASCDSFLDEMPDNRTDVNTEDKVVSLLTSAYPHGSGFYGIVNEAMSDNIDNMGSKAYESTDTRFFRQVYNWQEITESDNDGIDGMWEGYYGMIAAANQALVSIDNIAAQNGGQLSTKLKEAKGEALLCRAYGHFMLVNEFCMPYKQGSTDPGIPYATKPENHVNAQYERGTVSEVYEKIDKDIQAALPLIGDTHLQVPKYHFNTQAAYAFAARFYLYYEKWDKSVEYATECLGDNPKSMLRNWDEMESYGITSDLKPRTNLYIDAKAASNLLLCTAVSYVGVWGANYSLWTKYTHDTYISSKETLEAKNLWGSSTGSSSMLRCDPLVFKGGNMDRVVVAKLPYLFEVTDPVSQIGYPRTVYPAFKADLTLLERAEAYIMLKQYDKACADLSLWAQNWTKWKGTVTTSDVVAFFNSMKYYTWNAPTMKKHLHPAFPIDKEGSVQESMLQAVLSFKRIETVYEGLRWFDLRRYGITVYRRTMNAKSEPQAVTDSLKAGDLRWAIQLPVLVRSAGMQANPRP